MQYLKKSIRDNIIKSAMEEFKAYGYANASIRNIANNANISLGNIYRYFDNKEALYYSIINPLLDEVKANIDAEYNNPDSNIMQSAEKILGFLMKNSDSFVILRKGNTFHYNKFIDYLVDATTEKINKSMLEKHDKIKQRVPSPEFARIVASGFMHGVFQVLRNEGPLEAKKKLISELIVFYFDNFGERMG